MSSVGEGIGKSIGPLLIVGGLIAGAYLFRNQIAGWIRGLLPGKDDLGGAVEDGLGLAPGSIVGENGVSKDTSCRQKYGDAFIWNPWRGVCVNGWTGETPIDTTVPGTTPGEISDSPAQTITIPASDLCNWEPWKSSTACQSSREPITTPGYDVALGGVSNLVTGSAAEAYANAQAIRAQYQKPALTTYADLQKFNTNKYYLEHANGGMAYDLKVNESLGLIISGPEPTGYDKSFGWAVMRLTDNPDTSMDERGTIVSGVSGGTNPFGTAAFAPWFKQAISYENTLLGGV